ncbi:MAG: trehalose-phosphatase [Elusimicrobiales bacterium]|nr:trehalose-phosphatase [Elusimicrobiales bacterium]
MRSFWKNTGEISARLAGAPRLLVTLDFDGTLSALAKTPGQARLRPELKAALKELAAAPGVSVFVLSGRALESVRGLVGLRNLYYGGNHGIEIKGPGFSWRDPVAAEARGVMAQLAAGLKKKFPPKTGVMVENKVFSASVHYRNLKAGFRAGFFKHMKNFMKEQSGGLSWRKGHKVFELVVIGAANKGSAVNRLAAKLGRPYCLAAGDDLTDEDMFRALSRSGLTVRVGRKNASCAAYFLKDQPEVLKYLDFISALRRKK